MLKGKGPGNDGPTWGYSITLGAIKTDITQQMLMIIPTVGLQLDVAGTVA